MHENLINRIQALVCKLLLVGLALWGLYYASFLFKIVSFPFDWEATDGDHLNFAVRLAQGLPIYKNIGNGELLSIYNPLFYWIVAQFHFLLPISLPLGRVLSLVFSLTLPLVFVLRFRKRQLGTGSVVLLSLLSFIPCQPDFILDFVNFNPNTCMAALVVLSLYYLEQWRARQKPLHLLLLCSFSVLAVMTKQQGAIAGIIAFTVLLIDQFKKGGQLKSLLLFSFLCLGGLAVLIYCFERENDYQFLRATFFDLNKIMETWPDVGRDRLWRFLGQNLGVTVATFISIKKCMGRKFADFSVWQISVLWHIPFLCLVLANTGGGPNYFITFWFSLLMVVLDFLFESKIAFSKLKTAVYLNLIIAIFVNAIDLHKVSLPDTRLAGLMQTYYTFVKNLNGAESSPRVLTNRNAGAVVAAGFTVENEGSTEFMYAWKKPEFFNRNTVLNRLQNKQYAYIFTGIQRYPDEVQKLISANYQVIGDFRVNLGMGVVGNVQVYSPKIDIASPEHL